jgi:tripartite-type tricarboxylate transporter receptor subunit TctC
MMQKVKSRFMLSFMVAMVFLAERGVAQENFYAGKTIRVVVGYAPATTTDQWARIFARHAAKYIPGNPTLLVQNVAGASSMIAANQLYSVAKPDGLTIGFIAPALYFDQLIGRKEAQFDWSKFSWIGSPTRSNELLFVRADAPYKTVEDIRRASEPPKCGATGTASSGYYLPLLLEETLGMKFNIITGYQGGSDVDLAIERGEIHCRAFSISAFFAREPFHTWRKKAFVRVVLQTGMNRDGSIADVPTIYELMKQYQTPPRSQRLATVILAAGDIGRPIVAPAGLAPERLKILRNAFDKTVADAEFKADAQKQNLVWDPNSGEGLEALGKEVIAQPPEVVERLKKILGE